MVTAKLTVFNYQFTLIRAVMKTECSENFFFFHKTYTITIIKVIGDNFSNQPSINKCTGMIAATPFFFKRNNQLSSVNKDPKCFVLPV